MRLLFDGLCAAAAILIASGAASAADSAVKLIHKGHAAAPAATYSVACLGGVLAEGPTPDYLTVADYPAFAALTAGMRRVFICGDSIPSFLPSAERAGFVSHHH